MRLLDVILIVAICWLAFSGDSAQPVTIDVGSAVTTARDLVETAVDTRTDTPSDPAIPLLDENAVQQILDELQAYGLPVSSDVLPKEATESAPGITVFESGEPVITDLVDRNGAEPPHVLTTEELIATRQSSSPGNGGGSSQESRPQAPTLSGQPERVEVVGVVPTPPIMADDRGLPANRDAYTENDKADCFALEVMPGAIESLPEPQRSNCIYWNANRGQ